MSCASQVRGQLEELEGVVSVDVDFDDSSATVVVKKGTDPQDVADGLSGRYSGSVRD